MVVRYDAMLFHEGVAHDENPPGRGSGRYGYGTGENAFQHESFYQHVQRLKAEGWKDTPENIKAEFGLSSGMFRDMYSLAQKQVKYKKMKEVWDLNAEGKLSKKEIAEKMGIPATTLDSWLKTYAKAPENPHAKLAAFLKEQVDQKGIIDIGAGVATELGVTNDALRKAALMLQMEGYTQYDSRINYATNETQSFIQKTLGVPGTEWKDAYNPEKVHSVTDYISPDGGQTFQKFHYPESIDSSRIYIRYREDGGVDRDGLIEIRPGVDDLSLGNSHYAQVRIAVDGTHYMKGVAVYSDEIPEGYDVVFNSNKSSEKGLYNALKEMKPDPDNPFGALIKEKGGQNWYIDPKTGEQKLGLINKTREQNEWSQWSDNTPSQFLSKQSKALAKQQLGASIKEKQDEFDEIMALTNPVVKKYYLNKFAESCDTAAVELKGAAIPGQKYNVLIPINTLKDDECYCPRYEPGTKVALVRFPHQGPYEIPILTVVKNNAEGDKFIGKDSGDAIGINQHNANRLSGADYDGDAAMVIPTHGDTGIKITNWKPLKGLEGFEPKDVYATEKVTDPKTGKTVYMRNGKKVNILSKEGSQQQMGITTNLLMDMYQMGANNDDLAYATKHAQVIIDAEKHKLDYQASARDNHIAELKKKYQIDRDEDGNPTGRHGAATLLTRAKSEVHPLERQGQPKVNIKGTSWYDPNRPEGALIYKTATEYQRVEDPVTGKIVKDKSLPKVETKKTTKAHRMAEVDDARDLYSSKVNPTDMEVIYGEYANTMKDMARRARVEEYYIPTPVINKTAQKAYAKEVDSLKKKASDAGLNAPREREAQRRANTIINEKKPLYMEWNEKKGKTVVTDSKGLKKVRQKAIVQSRENVQAIARKDRNIKITDREWEAVQAGAVSASTLQKILNNTDPKDLRKRAMPKKDTVRISDANISRMKALRSSGKSLAEIAKALGVSSSTVQKYLSE